MGGRFFFAVVVPAEGEEVLRRVAAELEVATPRALRWVPPPNAHCTLRFLGELAGEEVEQALWAAGDVGSGVTPFPVTTGAPSVFDDVRRAHTLWVRFDVGGPELRALASRLGDALAARGFPREMRAFVPHLTVARFPVPWPAHEVRALLLRVAPALTFLVAEFALLESVREGRGVRYAVVQRFTLEPRRMEL